MQTKKRAKSVSFGKKKVEKEMPKESAPVELEEKPMVVVHSHKVEEETDVTESYPSESSSRPRRVHHETEVREHEEDHDEEPEEEYVSVARREDDDDEDKDDHDDRDRKEEKEEEQDEDDREHDTVEEYRRDDYDEEVKPRNTDKFDEDRYDEEGRRIDKEDDDEDTTIEPAEEALSEPFPTVNKEQHDPENEDEHPQIFGDKEDERRAQEQDDDDRDDKDDHDDRSDRYVDEDEAPREDSSGEPTFKGFSLPSEERRKRRGGGGNAGFFIIVTFLAFLFGLSGIIGFYYISKYQDLNVSSFMSKFGAEPTPTSEPTEAPTPTEAEVDLEAYTIKLLNGSGITGEAAKEKTSLIDAGFKVGTTGNADNSDYTQTVISVKKGVPEGYVKQLKAQLEKNYSVESSTQTLSDNPEGVDVTVTIGSTGAK
jgi:LytR cell envelope-related transcriptional attenuator